MQYVYLLRAGTDHYKVGVATNVRNRIHNLQTSNPQLIELVTARLCANAYDVEKQLHQSLIAMKTNGGTEWFKLKPEDAIELAIKINRFPDIDVSDKVTIQQVLEVQRAMAKSIQKQLDYVINTYQKPVRDNSTITSAATDLDEPSDLRAAKAEQAALAAFHDLVDRATIIIETEGKASTSLLQRRMSIGYGKASRILDELEKRGVVGPLDGIHREILHLPSLKAVRAAQSAIDI